MANVTQAEYEEMKRIVANNLCAECGAEIQIRTNQESGNLELGCPIDRSHHGYTETETYTQAMRRGAMVPVYIEDRIKKRMLPEKADLDRMTALVATRFSAANLDHPSAAVFILDCWRLDLDPLLGEIVPITFTSKSGKKVVTPIITEDGWLSMAARGCPDKWVGAPRVEPVTDADLKEAICNDRDGWVWKATGRTKDMTEGQETFAYGWLKRKEWEQAKARGTPAGELPGNQARVRAIKRWVRENFPEARHKMMELTREWMSRAEGVVEAQDVIEAEYRILAVPEEKKGELPQKGLATEAQQKFLLSLGKERLSKDEAQMSIACEERHHKPFNKLTKKEASEWIEELRALPKEEWVQPLVQGKEQPLVPGKEQRELFDD